jgi:hypothetical protein
MLQNIACFLELQLSSVRFDVPVLLWSAARQANLLARNLIQVYETFQLPPAWT